MSATVQVRSLGGDNVGSAELDEALFGIEPNVAVMHQVVTAQLAARRRGTQSTKTRAEARGGGAKPWRQKGTGRSRQGSIRSPQWRGGGVALGPKPRSYRQRTPKKMIQLALHSALSDRARDDKVVVVESWSFDGPKTKDAVATLEALGLDGRVLVVIARDDVHAARSFRNLSDAHVLTTDQLNAYDVLCSDWVVFSTASLPHARKRAKPTEPGHAAAETHVDPPTAAEVAGAEEPVTEAGGPAEEESPTEVEGPAEVVEPADSDDLTDEVDGPDAEEES